MLTSGEPMEQRAQRYREVGRRHETTCYIFFLQHDRVKRFGRI